MRSHARGWSCLWVGMLVVAGSFGWETPLPAAAARPAHGSCAAGSVASPHRNVRPHLDPVLDARGWLTGYRLMAGHHTRTERSTTFAFLDGPFGDRWVYGDREADRTRVRIWDAERGCFEAELIVDGLVFSTTIDPTGAWLVHDLVEATTREELGIWQRPLSDLDAGHLVMPGIDRHRGIGRVWANELGWAVDGHLVVRSCGDTGCITRRLGHTRADVHPGSSGPAGNDVPRVDTSARAGVGPRDLGPGSATYVPVGTRPVPAWVRKAVTDAAADVEASRRSRAGTFAYSDSGDDTIRLAAQMSGPCIAALACANGIIPSWWESVIRPQGAEVDWGTVRWCQAYDDPPAGCYDLEHAMVHEFGHIEGLAHPEDFGWRLGVLETVMATAPPQRPQTGWNCIASDHATQRASSADTTSWMARAWPIADASNHA